MPITGLAAVASVAAPLTTLTSCSLENLNKYVVVENGEEVMEDWVPTTKPYIPTTEDDFTTDDKILEFYLNEIARKDLIVKEDLMSTLLMNFSWDNLQDAYVEIDANAANAANKTLSIKLKLHQTYYKGELVTDDRIFVFENIPSKIQFENNYWKLRTSITDTSELKTGDWKVTYVVNGEKQLECNKDSTDEKLIAALGLLNDRYEVYSNYLQKIIRN